MQMGHGSEEGEEDSLGRCCTTRAWAGRLVLVSVALGSRMSDNSIWIDGSSCAQSMPDVVLAENKSVSRDCMLGLDLL